MDEKTKTLLRKKLEENERRIAQADEKARAIQDSVADLCKESRRIKARLRYERRKSETEDLRAQRDALEAEVKRLRAESASGRVPSPAVLRPQREAHGPRRVRPTVAVQQLSAYTQDPYGVSQNTPWCPS